MRARDTAPPAGAQQGRDERHDDGGCEASTENMQSTYTGCPLRRLPRCPLPVAPPPTSPATATSTSPTMTAAWAAAPMTATGKTTTTPRPGSPPTPVGALAAALAAVVAPILEPGAGVDLIRMAVVEIGRAHV